jgi:hypothetical protein
VLLCVLVLDGNAYAFCGPQSFNDPLVPPVKWADGLCSLGGGPSAGDQGTQQILAVKAAAVPRQPDNAGASGVFTAFAEHSRCQRPA